MSMAETANRKSHASFGRRRTYAYVIAGLVVCALTSFYFSRKPDYKKLLEAAGNGDERSLNYAIDHGADPQVFNQLSGTIPELPLHLAAREGRTNIVRALLSHGIEVDLKLKGGITPLMESASARKTETAAFLIEHGANVNATADEHGMTPLLSALSNGDTEMVKLLLRSGANPNTSEREGTITVTPLLLAVQRGDTRTVQALLEGGADPNRDFGALEITPLDSASQDGRLEIVQLLLSRDAKPRGLDVQWAAEKGHCDVAVAILRNVGNKHGWAQARSWQRHDCPKFTL